ncbi:calcium uptake protein 2, mitochondrial isoform X3 [Loxodonta africana]|uniref:calcium uptake protein 2, mitochondrial isoform X3 n=1 Tax=Loxodonta africana TaxID=9785 RepID=UPI0030D13B41
MAAAGRGPLLATWGGRLRRALAASRRALPGPAPLAAAVAGAALTGAGVGWYRGRVTLAAPEGNLTVLAQGFMGCNLYGMRSPCLFFHGTAGWIRAANLKKNVDSDEMVGKLSLRKQRFMQFSSLEHEGEYYMTPRDFLFSVMFEQMERKTLVKKLTKKDIEDALAGIQKAGWGPTFFRDLGDKGLISYTEYLFLLTILTKPHTGFHVAFKMLDSDGDEMVEKKEFFKLQKIISKQDELKTTVTNDTECQEPKVQEPEVNTTLQIRFFGKRGEKKLHYKEFRRFMENLQTEVQEMEFLQFSRGLSFMRKEDFAEWLLFFTNSGNKDIYWKNVREKLSAGEVPQQLTVQEYWKCVKKESIKGVKEVWKQAGKSHF